MKNLNRLVASLFLCVVLSSISFIANAEETDSAEPKSEKTTEVLQIESESLLTELQDMVRNSSLLRQQYAKVPEIDRPLYLNLVFILEGKLRDKLDQLIANYQLLDQREVVVQPVYLKIKEITGMQSQIIKEDIQLMVELSSWLREHKAKDESLQLTIERVNLEVNNLISAWQQNIDREKELNMDFTRDIEELSQIVQLRAIMQSGRIQLILDTIKLLNNRIKDAPEAEQKTITQQLHLLETRKKTVATNLEEMVVIMNKLGMETTSFGQVLVVATGEILNENVDTKAVLGLFQILINKSMYWLKDNLPMIIFRIISFVIIILVFRLISGILRRFVDRAASRSQLKSSQLLQEFLGSITSKVVMLIGIIIALSQLGIEIGPLLAGMGVMGFVVGFALQDSLSNFASGLMILFYRPFDIGDFVEVAGISGEVKQMTLVSTTILTADRKRMIIPNSKIWGDIITNVTAETLRRIDFVFGIGYPDNIAKAENVLLDIVEHHELILVDPKPVIKVHTLGESSVDFIVRPWVKTEDYWAVYWDITRQVKEKFDEEGISIPYPQRDIHVITDNSSGAG